MLKGEGGFAAPVGSASTSEAASRNMGNVFEGSLPPESVAGDLLEMIDRYLGSGQPWRASAACKGQSYLFFPVDDETPRDRFFRSAKAKSICAGCPVLQECKDDVKPGEVGIRAGVTWDRHQAGNTAGTTPWPALSEAKRQELTAQLIDSYSLLKNVDKAGATIGINQHRAAAILRENNVHIPEPAPRVDWKRSKEAAELYRSGLIVRDVAKAMNLGRRTVERMLKMEKEAMRTPQNPTGISIR